MGLGASVVYHGHGEYFAMIMLQVFDCKILFLFDLMDG